MNPSFRDPGGTLVSLQGRIFRVVTPAGAGDLEAFLCSDTARRWFEASRLVRTTRPDPEAAAAVRAPPGHIVYEHEPIPFPSYPYEWPAEMLHAAGVMTLDLSLDLLEEGFGLKDGTPYNVLFRGPDPVFVDLLSFERRDQTDPTWLAYAQFVRTFMLPLLAARHFGLSPGDILLTRRDGLEPEEVYRWAGPLRRLKPGFLTLVTLPSWLGARGGQDDAALYRKRSAGNPEKARFILSTLLGRLRRMIRRLEPGGERRSAWAGYMETQSHYSETQFAAKEAFVRQVLAAHRPKKVLDVGCNTGHFSALSAAAGASVVAVDPDPVVVGAAWRRARDRRLDVLPLVVNLARPTPATGWRNRECPSFLERATGAFDLVLMLALLHHLLVSERVPLLDVLDLAAGLTTSLLVIEFIAPDDPMFRRIARGREELHRDLTRESFERACHARFEILLSEPLEGSRRWMYLLRKR